MLTSIKSAFISGLLTAILGVAGYIIGVGDIFRIDLQVLTNVFVMSLLTTMVSLLKSLVTTKAGTALGVKVK
jgi:membrane-associated HD superfamily phosphohydrolase